MEKKLEQIRHLAEILHAIEVLEYRDMNWLSGNDKSRCEAKMQYLAEIRDTCRQVVAEHISEKETRILRDRSSIFNLSVTGQAS